VGNKDQSGYKATARRSLAFIIMFIIFAFFGVLPVNAQPDANAAFRLIGTMKGKHLSGAVLQDSTGQQTFYQLHDKLPDGSQIVKLRDDSISLKNENGTMYDMYIAHDTKSVSSSSSNNASIASPRRHETTQHERESLQRKKQRISDRNRRLNNDKQ
jgi:hypothetical protein